MNYKEFLEFIIRLAHRCPNKRYFKNLTDTEILELPIHLKLNSIM